MSNKSDNLRKVLQQMKNGRNHPDGYNPVWNQYTVSYDEQKRNILDILCEKYGSDKGYCEYTGQHVFPWNPHNYTDHYHELFGHCRQYIQNVLECGLGTNNTQFKSNMTETGMPGASLRIWRDYFPIANIVGLDIDGSVLFTEERIQTYQCDQTDTQQVFDTLYNLDRQFDIIIDDGLHEFEAGFLFFHVASKFLTPNGVYIIEDVKEHDFRTYKKILGSNDKYFVKFIELERDDEQVHDNNLIVIRKK